ncbi:MAG: iron-containing alcohol dehydrogenase [Planctomycetia bacterium]|nr:iron-containing alcohol dehydrogenase [Planctomycetia bacterium]
MQDFEFRGPTRLVVGPGTLDRLGELARGLGATRALVASDAGVVDAGHTAAGLESLQAAGIATRVFSGFGENPTTDEVQVGAAVAREFCPDLLVGLGPASGMKMACGDPRAAFHIAILDVNLTLTQPLRLAALTGIDALSHAVESHVSLAATPASRIFSREAWRLLATSLPGVFADGGTIRARADVQLAAAWAGLAIENAMLGAAHALANPLTAAHGVVHGQAVGLMLPHVVRFNGPCCDAAYAELLRDIGIEAAAGTAGLRLAEWLTALMTASRLGRSLGELGIATPDVPALAAAAATQWTGGFNPRPVACGEFAAFYEAAR